MYAAYRREVEGLQIAELNEEQLREVTPLRNIQISYKKIEIKQKWYQDMTAVFSEELAKRESNLVYEVLEEFWEGAAAPIGAMAPPPALGRRSPGPPIIEPEINAGNANARDEGVLGGLAAQPLAPRVLPLRATRRRVPPPGYVRPAQPEQRARPEQRAQPPARYTSYGRLIVASERLTYPADYIRPRKHRRRQNTR